MATVMSLGLLDDDLGFIVLPAVRFFFARLDCHFQLLFLAAASIFQL